MNTFKDEKCWRFLGSISVDHLHKIGLKLKSQTFWFEIISPTVYLFFIGKKNPRWLFWNKKNLKENKLHGHNNYGLRFFPETSHWWKCYKYSIHLNQKSSYFVLEYIVKWIHFIVLCVNYIWGCNNIHLWNPVSETRFNFISWDNFHQFFKNRP